MQICILSNMANHATVILNKGSATMRCSRVGFFFAWAYSDDGLCQLNILGNRSHFSIGTYQPYSQLNHRHSMFECILMPALSE